MTKNLGRHQLRLCAFQALLAVEFGAEPLTAAAFAYWHEEDVSDDQLQSSQDLPLFLLNLVTGVQQHRQELDELLTPRLKAGWTLERLTLVEKTLLRLGLFEIKFFEETPGKVAVNEAVELAKTFSDPQAARFVNGILSQFITE